MAKGTPSLNLIRVFDAAARTGSFARAAQRLAMSAPAVSQQIRALEQHLGRQLFHRDAAGVRLTDEGRALLSACTAPLAQIESATAEFARPRQKTLVIGASLMFSVAWLAPRLPQFLAANPGLRLDLRALHGRPEQAGHDVDIWVAFGPFGPGLVAQRLFGERLTPVATPELAQTIRTRDALLAQHLIEPSAHETTWAHVLGLQVLPTGTRTTKVDNSLAALHLAAAGAAWRWRARLPPMGWWRSWACSPAPGRNAALSAPKPTMFFTPKAPHRAQKHAVFAIGCWPKPPLPPCPIDRPKMAVQGGCKTSHRGAR